MNRFLVVGILAILAGCVVEERGVVAPNPAAPPIADAPVPQAPASVSTVAAPAPVSAPAPVVIAQSPPSAIVVIPANPPIPDEEIIGIYEDLLGRRPSGHELWEWRERSRERPLTTEQIRDAIRASDAFRNLDPTAVVVRACRETLGHEPSHEMLRYYRRRLIDDDWSAGRVRHAIAYHERRFSDADEFTGNGRGRHRDLERNWDETDDWDPHSPDAIVERAYDDLLEREPDPAGREQYIRLLSRGVSEKEIRSRIKQSVEYRVNLPDSKTTRAYRKILGRDPDASGMESYRRKLVDQGWTEQDVENSLRNSAEYRNRKK